MAAAARFEDFAIAVSSQDDTTVVTLRGELDLATAGQLRSTLHGLQGTALHVVLDCSRLAFIDSAGLAVMVAASRRFRQAGGELVVRRPTRAVLRVLELTGVIGEVQVERNGDSVELP